MVLLSRPRRLNFFKQLSGSQVLTSNKESSSLQIGPSSLLKSSLMKSQKRPNFKGSQGLSTTYQISIKTFGNNASLFLIDFEPIHLLGHPFIPKWFSRSKNMSKHSLALESLQKIPSRQSKQMPLTLVMVAFFFSVLVPLPQNKLSVFIQEFGLPLN